MFLCCFFFPQILTTAIQPPPSHSYNHHLHIGIHLPPPQTTATQCSSASGVCASVGGRKKITSTSCNRWHHHQCKECLCQWLMEKCHQRKLQPVTTTMCVSGVLYIYKYHGISNSPQLLASLRSPLSN